MLILDNKIEYLTKGLFYLMSDIGDFIKKKRKENKLRQADLALYAGVSTKFLNELEGGKETLKMDKVNQVLHLFHCQLGVVCIEEEKEAESNEKKS